MASSKVIVFGPTGKVGSATAITAQQHGAKVFLAMRDTQKPIPGLTSAQEQAGGFERVQADLTKPDTISAAVAQTGAKHAFTSLKAAGIDFVVFLSSLTVTGELARIPPSESIPWLHAQGEIALADVFGTDGYAAVRPGLFASNLLQLRDQIAAGATVRISAPGARCDYISPEDIRAVSGALLAKGPSALDAGKAEKNAIYLCGPQRISQADAVVLIGKAIGKDVKVEDFATEQDAVDGIMRGLGMPEVAARYLVGVMHGMCQHDGLFATVNFEEAVANVERYGGKPATDIHAWIAANKSKLI
ncbi:NAD(P)-binding protein [Trichocladium antarcticum]|uniref:NAD(P)-binding protein n=1 Tax=Trichocladium antarcticum TaxID=1450529 RepID=A0AAN6UT25_9PEZI|nr:NAD(P)-binding protein [Trichocladium antarcticum]